MTDLPAAGESGSRHELQEGLSGVAADEKRGRGVQHLHRAARPDHLADPTAGRQGVCLGPGKGPVEQAAGILKAACVAWLAHDDAERGAAAMGRKEQDVARRYGRAGLDPDRTGIAEQQLIDALDPLRLRKGRRSAAHDGGQGGTPERRPAQLDLCGRREPVERGEPAGIPKRRHAEAQLRGDGLHPPQEPRLAARRDFGQEIRGVVGARQQHGEQKVADGQGLACDERQLAVAEAGTRARRCRVGGSDGDALRERQALPQDGEGRQDLDRRRRGAQFFRGPARDHPAVVGDGKGRCRHPGQGRRRRPRQVSGQGAGQGLGQDRAGRVEDRRGGEQRSDEMPCLHGP